MVGYELGGGCGGSIGNDLLVGDPAAAVCGGEGCVGWREGRADGNAVCSPNASDREGNDCLGLDASFSCSLVLRDSGGVCAAVLDAGQLFVAVPD